jgi:hypothetical protein
MPMPSSPEKPPSETISVTRAELNELMQARQERDLLVVELGLLAELVREGLIGGQEGESLIRMAAAAIRAAAAERFAPHIQVNMNEIIVGAFSLMWTEFSNLQTNREVTPHQARMVAFSRAVQSLAPPLVDYGRDQSLRAVINLISTQYAMIEKEMNEIETKPGLGTLEKHSLMEIGRARLNVCQSMLMEVNRFMGGGRSIGDPQVMATPPTSKQVN